MILYLSKLSPLSPQVKYERPEQYHQKPGKLHSTAEPMGGLVSLSWLVLCSCGVGVSIPEPCIAACVQQGCIHILHRLWLHVNS